VPIEHFGFVVDGEQYAALRAPFSGLLQEPEEVLLSGGGLATVGLQKPDGLSWSYGYPIPALALVMSTQLGLPPGGSYATIQVGALSQSGRHLGQARPSQLRSKLLMGRNAAMLPLSTRAYGEGPGIYALFFVTSDLMQVTQAIRATLRAT